VKNWIFKAVSLSRQSHGGEADAGKERVKRTPCTPQIGFQ